MLESFGIDGAIRISPLHCNNYDEIDEFLKITLEMTQKSV
jgi:selenocysteine lyase/cysteine desulfurase